VVDSADTERVSVCKDELLAMLDEEELKGAALCVFANKQDLPGALTAQQVSEELGLSSIRNREWAIFKTSATKGEGLNNGLDWLVATITSKR
jgi:ADP-ribosylation factor-like protein 1